MKEETSKMKIKAIHGKLVIHKSNLSLLFNFFLFSFSSFLIGDIPEQRERRKQNVQTGR